MIDKQIIERLKTDLDFERTKIKSLQADLKDKEQECDELKKECEIWKNQVLTIDDEAITVQITQQQFEEYNKLKAENEELKKCYKNNSALLCFEETNTTKLVNKVMKLDKTLTEIKPILEFYANSNMGEEQSNGTYKILSNGICITIYDPKPARQALQKIREVENDNTRKI